MALRYDFSVQTNLGNVADPVQTQDAATKAYVDSRPTGGNVYVDTNGTSTNLALATANAAIGATAITVAGDVTALLLPGTRIGIPTDSTVYRVLSTSVSVGNTTITITPALVVALASGGQVTYQPITQTQFTDVVAGSNITLTQFGKQLQISASGSSTTVSINGTTVSNPNFQDNAAALGLIYTVSGSNITANIRNADVAAVADTEIAAKIGSAPAFNPGVQVSTSGTTLLIPAGQVDVSRANALTLWQTITGSSSSTLPTAALAPLPQYSYLSVSQTGTQGNYSGAYQYNTVQVPLGNAGIYFNFTTVPAAFTSSTPSNWVYYGDGTTGQTPIFAFQTPPNLTILSEIAANSVNSLNSVQGPMTLVAGTGIAISTSLVNKSITISNTASGGNITGSAAVIGGSYNGSGLSPYNYVANLSPGNNVVGVYCLPTGGQTDTYTYGSGSGAIAGTQVISTNPTFNAGYGNGLRYPSTLLYNRTGLLFTIDIQTINFTITTTNPVTNFNNFNSWLFEFIIAAPSTVVSGNLDPTAANNPIAFFNSNSDGDSFFWIQNPTSFSAVNTSGNTYNITITGGILQLADNDNPIDYIGSNTDYALWMTVKDNNNNTNIITGTTAVTTSTRFSLIQQIFLQTTSGGGSGGAGTLQQTLNLGNSANTSTGNIASLILTNSATTKSTTISATNGVETQQLLLDGSTSGAITLKAAATTNSYPLVLPATQGNNGQQLTDDGAGNLSWYNNFEFIQAVSVINVATLSGSQVIDGYTTSSGDLVLLTNQTTASQNGLYVVSSTNWSKQTSYNTQQVFALQGITGQFTTWSKSSTSGNEVWTKVNYNSLPNYETGYKVTNSVTNVLTVTKIDGTAASSSDWLVGDGVWADGITTTIPQGQLTVLAVGTPYIPSGGTVATNIDLTISSAAPSFTAGAGARRIPRVTNWNFPIVSTAGGGTGIALGSGLSLDANGKLQSSGSGTLDQVLQAGNTSARTATVGGLTLQNQNVTTPGTLTFNGLTTGSVTFKASNSTTSYNLVLPPSQGIAASVLTNDGSGNLTWGTGGGGGGNFPTYAIQYAINGFAQPAGYYDTPIQSTISFNNSTRLFTISVASGYSSYNIWTQGTLNTITTTYTTTIPSTTGLYYVYFQLVGGTLTIGTSASNYDFEQQIPIATIYWNANTSSATIFGDERHGLMDWRTHEYLHRTRGAAYATGFDITGSITGNGTAATDAQIGISNGTFYDEDIRWDLTGSTVPQSIPILAKALTAWITYPATAYPYYYISGTQTAAYNLNTAGSWSTVGIPSNSYGVMYVLATNDTSQPFLALMGQNYYSSIGNANAATWNDLDLSGLPLVEFRVLWKLVFQTKSSYTNAVHVNQVAFQDFRSNAAAQLPPPTYNATDTVFRDSPATVFATDSTALTSWTSVIQTYNALLAGASPSSTIFNRLVAAAPLYLNVDVNNVATIGTSSVLSYKSSVVGATVANLSATYNNGSAGIGATLTSTVNGAFTVDGVTFVATNRVLIKDQTASVQNGIYTVTTLGTGATPWVLTRATDMDEPSEFTDAVVIISQGIQNGGDSWVQTGVVNTIGVDPVIWTKFAENGTPTLQSVVLTGNSSSNPIYMQSSSGTGFELFPGGSGVDPGTISQSNDGSTDVGFHIQAKGVGSLTFDSISTANGGIKFTPAANKMTITTLNTSGSGTTDLYITTAGGSRNGNIILTGGLSAQSVTFTLPTGTSSAYMKVDPGIANNTYWNASQFAIGQYTTGTTVDTGKLALVIDASTTNNIGLTVSTPQATAVNMTLTAGPATSAIILKTTNASNTNYLTITPSISGGNLNFAAADGNIQLTPTATNAVAITSPATSPNTVRIFPKATGSDPTLTVASSDTNRGLTIITQGSGSLTFAPGGTGVSSLVFGGSTTGNTIQASGTNAILGLVPTGTGNVIVYNPAQTTSLKLIAPAATGTSYAKIDANSANAMVLNANTLTVGAQSTGSTIDGSTAAFRIDATSASAITLSVQTPQTTTVDLNIVAGPSTSAINFGNGQLGNGIRFAFGATSSAAALISGTGNNLNFYSPATTTASGFSFYSAATGGGTIKISPLSLNTVSPGSASSIYATGGTDNTLDFGCTGAGLIRLFNASSVDYISISPPTTASPSTIFTSTGNDSALSIDFNIKGPLAGAAFNVGAGTGYSKLSHIPGSASYLLQLNSTTGVTAADLQFRTLGTGSVYKFISGDGTNSFTMTPSNTTTSYNLFDFGSIEARFGTTSSAGFTFGNLTSGSGVVSTTAVNLRATSTQAIAQSVGSGGTAYDFVLRAQSTGNVVLGTGGNGISLGNTTSYTTPILAANDPTTPTALNSGTSGQILTSAGSGKTPYWANNATALKGGLWSITSATNAATGAGTIATSSFTQQFNNLGVTTSGNIWTIPANLGKLKITIYMNISGQAAYTSYWAFSTGSSIATSVGYGTGTTTSIIQFNSGGFTSSSTGGTPASTTILRAYGSSDSFANTGIGFLNNSASTQSLYLTYYQQSGSNISIQTSTFVLIEQVPY